MAYFEEKGHHSRQTLSQLIMKTSINTLEQTKGSCFITVLSSEHAPEERYMTHKKEGKNLRKERRPLKVNEMEE